ncbi:hypothetical protein C8Q77DRAFT_300904 [Trametes polyzona]|nr:hypothetical protein C8Q77DRAFT_300904 [Trametes polyzona]
MRVGYRSSEAPLCMSSSPNPAVCEGMSTLQGAYKSRTDRAQSGGTTYSLHVRSVYPHHGTSRIGTEPHCSTAPPYLPLLMSVPTGDRDVADTCIKLMPHARNAMMPITSDPDTAAPDPPQRPPLHVVIPTASDTPAGGGHGRCPRWKAAEAYSKCPDSTNCVHADLTPSHGHTAPGHDHPADMSIESPMLPSCTPLPHRVSSSAVGASPIAARGEASMAVEWCEAEAAAVTAAGPQEESINTDAGGPDSTTSSKRSGSL